MAKKPVNWWLWTKMLVGGGAICVGGPMLTVWVMPTEEELVKRYNPELQKRSIETREQRLQEYDDFVTKLKEYSKSNKPIWTVMAEEEEKKKRAQLLSQRSIADEAKARREEMRKEAGLSGKS